MGQTGAQQVADRLRQSIRQGRYRPGAQLATEPLLAEELGTSRATLREALQVLAQEGWIDRVHGVGTFVTHRRPLTNTLEENFGVTELIERAGMTPGTREIRLYETVPPDPVREALLLEDSACVMAIERVRTADGSPVVYSIDYLPSELIQPGTLFIGESVYAYLGEVCGLPVSVGEATLRPVRAPVEVAQALDLEPGDLLLVMEQTDFDVSGHPVLYSIEYHLADAFQFVFQRRGPGYREGRMRQDEASAVRR